MFRENTLPQETGEGASAPPINDFRAMPKPKSASAYRAKLTKSTKSSTLLKHDHVMVEGDCEALLARLPREPLFDLIVTSPPYNIGKSYEKKTGLDIYLDWQERIIAELIPRLKDGGSICWQVGNYVHNNEVFPLDIEFDPIFKQHGLRLRNRIVWQFGHGLHNKRRFSGRYEVVMWYTKSGPKDEVYTFNLDAVRVPSKYPGKRHFKGPKAGHYSGNPLGKNPEDVWDIPNVKSNHVEKTNHPCQFPVGLIERLVLALTNPGDLVFDPFAGVGSAGVGAAIHGRRFLGAELNPSYVQTGVERINEALNGTARYRPHDKPLHDHTSSPLAVAPKGFKHGQSTQREDE